MRRERGIVILFLFALFNFIGQSSWAFSLTGVTSTSSLEYRVSEKEHKSHKVFIQEEVEEIEEVEDDGHHDTNFDSFSFVRYSSFFFTTYEYLVSLLIVSSVLATKNVTTSLFILFRNLRN